MPFPLIGMGLARIGAGAILKKVAGRALRVLTKGKLIGQGGGAIIARRAVGAGVTVATAAEVARQVRRAPSREIIRDRTGTFEEEAGSGRRYRRMNPMNVRALRRSVRRINSAEKLFRKVFTITKGQVNVRKARRSS